MIHATGRIRRGVLAALVLLVLAAPASSPAESYVFKVATLAPQGIGWSKKFEQITRPAMTRATDGELRIKMYWGGIMGDDGDYVRKMRIGQLHGAAITGLGATLVCPEMTVVGLPFMFNGYDEVQHIKDTMYEEFDAYFQKSGHKLVYWVDQDFDQVYSTKYRMDELEHFSNARLLTWYGPMESRTLEMLGANPVPVAPPEVASALRQGIIDSLVCPSIWVVGSQSYMVLKYVTPLRMRYAPGMQVFSLDAWNSLPKRHRDGIMASRRDVERRFCQESHVENDRAYKALVDFGVQEVIPEPGFRDKVREMTRPVWKELAGREFDPALLDQVMARLEEYRSRNLARNP
ncbi:MAG: TRAP transporter substrate-binding protein DctP [Desulfatibacillaceae bacterium]